jgi:hypothetical protein
MADGMDEGAGGPEASALGRVVDDDTPRREAVDWAAEALQEGAAFEAVAASLVAEGWPAEEAEELVEAARVRTREGRGVVTRDRVVGAADRYYRRATGRWVVGMPVLGAAWRLLHSLATLVALRRAGGGPASNKR